MRFHSTTSSTSKSTPRSVVVILFMILVMVTGVVVYITVFDLDEKKNNPHPLQTEAYGSAIGDQLVSRSLDDLEWQVWAKEIRDGQYLAAVSERSQEISVGRSLTTTRTATTLSSNAPASPEISSSPDDAFWRRLANCECASGTCANGAGFFQFTDPGTARKAGYVQGSSYEEQLAAAKRWLAKLQAEGSSGGSRGGWPTCWWTALRDA